MVTTYEVRVAGPVPDDLLAELGDVTISVQETRTLVLGNFADQAALHGFLQRLRAFGLDLVEVRKVAQQPTTPGVSESGQQGDD